MKSIGRLAFLFAAAGALVTAQPAFSRGSGGHSGGGGHLGGGHFSSGGGSHFSGGHVSSFSAGSHFAPSRGFAAPRGPHFAPRPFAPRPFISAPRFYPRGPAARVIIAAPFVAAPLFYYPPPAYYPAPAYLPPAAVIPPSQYIEQAPSPEASTPDASTQQYWYYCAESNAYYPYVKECPGGWQAVPPQPPS